MMTRGAELDSVLAGYGLTYVRGTEYPTSRTIAPGAGRRASSGGYAMQYLIPIVGVILAVIAGLALVALAQWLDALELKRRRKHAKRFITHHVYRRTYEAMVNDEVIADAMMAERETIR